MALCGLTLFLASCSGGSGNFTYEKPKAGTPDTPYWFQVGDSLFWYLPHDSLSLVQMQRERPDAQKSTALKAVRELGWRMTVERTRAMYRPGDPQELSQALFAVEKVGDAKTPVTHYREFEKAFWKKEDSTFMAWLPGLLPYGEQGTLYLWPSALVVAWKPGLAAASAQAFLDSLGFRVVTPPGLAHQYWVERAWAIELRAGDDLFTWLRRLNRDPRVQLAHPVFAQREPPVPDHRLLRKFEAVRDTLVPAGMEKLSAPLLKAWEIAQFCGHTRFVTENTGIEVSGERLHVRISSAATAGDIYELIRSAGGEALGSQPGEALIPYHGLPVCAADSRVGKIEDVAANLLK